MNSIRKARLLQVSGLMLSVLVWLANSNNPSNGRTGAPFDGHCNSCHTGNNPNGFNGTVEITGMPTAVLPNTVYPLMLTMTPTAGNPFRGGFQLVAVDGNNLNAGNLATVNTQCGTEMSSGREYIEHRGAKNFTGGGPASWSFNWTSPATANGAQIKFFFIGNFGNNDGDDTGDRPIAFSSTYSFNGPSEPVTASISSFSNVTCNGAANGTVTVTASGGTAPYTYAWNNGQTTATAVNLGPGTYTVTVTGASGSGTATASRVITQPSGMTLTVNSGSAITCAQNSANISVTVQGGVSPYAYNWTNGANTQQTSVTQAGTYTVTVTDNSGCTKTATANVSANTTAPTAVVAQPATLTCNVTSLSLNGTGSSTGANFTYAWTATNGGSIVTGATTLNPVVNACGTYTLTVTNTVNGCTATASRTVVCNTTPPQVSVAGGNITCNTPTITLQASSTTPGVSYQWSGPCITPNNQNQQNPVVCAPGTYTVTVTNTTTGCTATASTIVTEDTVTPILSIGNVGVITCGSPTVVISATTNALSASYAWSGPCFVGSQQISNPTVCAPGTYTATVTNPVNGCTNTASGVVQQNTNLPLAAIATPARLNCNNSSVQLDATASAQGAAYAYAWTTVNGNIVAGGTTLTPTVDEAGSYQLLVTDLTNACTSTASASVLESAPVTANASSTPAACSGEASGSATAVASGGVGPYQYLWSNDNTSATANNIAAGLYAVTASDSEGCTAVTTTTVAEPTALQISVTTTAQTALNLADGTAGAVASGGTPDYSYAWSNNGTTSSITGLAPGIYFVTATDANGCSAIQVGNVNSFNCNLSGTILSVDISCNGAANGSASVQTIGATEPVNYQWSNFATTPAISNLAPGPYLVSLTDAAGCPLVLGVEIQEPAALTILTTATGVSSIGATDGTASALPSGGTPGYTYLWSTNATTATIGNLAPGTYTVTVRDANSCSEIQTVVVPSVSCALEAEMSVFPVKCFGTASGMATVEVTGATGELSYLWSSGASTDIADSLTGGIIMVTVTDEAGCSVTGTGVVPEPESPLVASAVNINNVACPSDLNGSATPSITGGWGTPYAFQFSWGLGGFNNLSVGDYSFTVTDSKGCAVVATFEIAATDTIPPSMVCPDNLVLCGADLVDFETPVVTDNCSGGDVEATLILGLPSGSAFLDGVTTQVFRAADASGNSSSCSFTVTVYPVSDVIINEITDDSNGSGAGSIDIAAVGDSGPYTFEWEKDGAFFAATEDLSNLNTGTYTLVMTDVNGCTVQLAPIFIDNLVGTEDPASVEGKIKLWPNPARNIIRLEMTHFEPVAMEILNAQGQLVRVLQSDEWNSEISVDALPVGFYYLKMVSRRGACHVEKWVKGE